MAKQRLSKETLNTVDLADLMAAVTSGSLPGGTSMYLLSKLDGIRSEAIAFSKDPSGPVQITIPVVVIR